MGQYPVRVCGYRHAYCKVCKPEVAEKLRKPKPKREYERPCRNCGTCMACKGYIAPAGMKYCSICVQAKPLEAFSRRYVGLENFYSYCKQCRKERSRKTDVEAYYCAECGRQSTRVIGGPDLCRQCRPKMPNKNCRYCGEPFASGQYNRSYCSTECRYQVRREVLRQEDRARRERIIEHYGGANPACQCCGETEPKFLNLDHINGGGYKQKKELGNSGFIRWIEKANYPLGFRLLCWNCNQGRQLNGGECPHNDPKEPRTPGPRLPGQ